MGKWVDLNPDIPSLILLRIPTHQRVSTASLVCKSWLSCVLDPFLWSDIDLLDWYRRHPYLETKYVDSTVRKLIRRSKGTFRRLFSVGLGDAGFAFIANCGRCLKVLEIPMSEVNDKTVVKFTESLANLTVSNISYCSKITHVGIEAFGKNCKSWTQLKRNMPPRALESERGWCNWRTGPGHCLLLGDPLLFTGKDEQDDGDAEYSSSDSEWKILFLHPG
ncbi:hypothetical protein J1N35_027630 [Gossypium stocksii]|uniref:F-box domain-containing protein n=1 Tax=Gossypium stocksii TaxID=47602 RepID=A0A9D3ZZB1_9ROSI|nr:hypothetical protein J1N35_027630 [Gossypium stocksii]